MKSNILVISENRKAKHDYIIEKVFEAGLVLTGSEVKSLRARKVQLKDSYVGIKSGEAFWYKGHISPYDRAGYAQHEAERPRKLLMKKREILEVHSSIERDGRTCIPLKIYFKGGKAKLEIGIARGKSKADKRASIKTQEAKRAMERAIKNKILKK